jgi:hypothetical protein
MKCNHTLSNGRLEFAFETDEADMKNIKSLSYSMTDEIIYFDLPEEVNEIHPDLLGLAAILLCNPFVGDELSLPIPVSRNFFEGASGVISRYNIIENVDESILPITKSESRRPGLAFSGGADSAAALAIMPASTVPIFLNRPMVQSNRYDSDAPLKICKMLSDSGYEVHIINSNLEFLRNPVGFPTDLANSVPGILMSEFLDLDSIGFGTVLESGYGIGHEKFIDYGEGSHWAFYATMFKSTGLDLCLPTLGISEVGTAIIGKISPIATIGQSCIRGSWKRPCNKCWKCFRKELLSFAIKDDDSEHPNFRKMLEISEVQIRLSSFPISHENVIAYSIQRIDIGKFSSLKPISAKLEMDRGLSFLEKWYPKSIDFVPDRYRNYIRSKIMDFLEPTTFEEEEDIESWNMNPHLASTRTIRAQDRLISYWQDIS